MLIVEIGYDGTIESFEGEEGMGQLLIDGEWFNVNDNGEITERVVFH